MKVYVVQVQYCTGSWGDRDCLNIDSIKDSEEKAKARIKELVEMELPKNDDDYNYPKVIEEEPSTITIARNGYEDEDFTQFFYEEFEVG